MARNGSFPIQDLVVEKVVLVKAGTSSLIARKGPVTLVIETTGQFPDDFVPKPNGTIDILLAYDPKP